MRNLSIDIETYSSADLAKSGVYRYCESPDFRILLFAYSVDGGPVHVVDLECGEKIPDEVLSALTDPSVFKWAFNAQFERICLSRYLGYPVGHYLTPSDWRCTMVWAATLGLPLSLENVGAVIGLEKQKLKEGKDLIRYFCVPAKMKDGTLFRHLSSDAPEKWERFKLYNLRDVETEMGIQQKLSKFPVPESEWTNYILDQQINDRGIMLDRTMVRQAIRCDEEFKRTHMEQARNVTGLENPNSPVQLKAWLAEKGVDADSLSKAAVLQMLEKADGEVELALSLRKELAKSSVKKYTAMESVVGSDSRARGLIQFYGANRTGRWCLTGDHEILTDYGWIPLSEWQGGVIACWSPHGELVSFQKADAVSFDYEGEMYEYEDKRISQISTPDHKMWVKRKYDGEWQNDTIENMAKYRPSIPFTGRRITDTGLEHSQLRVLVMVQADGHYTADGSIRFSFKKPRKIERCKHLLRTADIPFVFRTYEQSCVSAITINSRDVPLWLRLFRDKTFGTWLFDESPDVFFDELVYWDGYRSAKNSIQYSTCNKQNADMVQAFAHLTGRCALIGKHCRSTEHANWKDAYVVDIWLTPKNCHEIKSKPIIHHYNGKVYCAVTPTGYFLVRRNGRVWVTGNSGRLIQVQNLPQNHLPDLDAVRSLIRDGQFEAVEMLYDSVPMVLSELIRTAFIPKPGHRFFVADFAAIEARVIAWLAGEQWRQEVFASGGDIYCASASQMFHVPVEKHGQNSHLRQKGKIAELALGYGGSVGALKAMGALNYGLQESELKPLVDAWRQSNPRIVRFWWDVDSAAKTCVKEHTTAETHGIKFHYQSGMLFIVLPSGRKLVYVRPRIGENKFGGESITYEGVGEQKKWLRLESYGPKFVENIVQATARDILAEAMLRLDAHGYKIVMHVHDEAVIEAPADSSLEAICKIMGENPSWTNGLLLRADGYVCDFYKKD